MMFNLGKSPLEHDAHRLRPLVMERGRLTRAAGATDTSIYINSLPRGVGAYSGWVLIDPFTVQCELREITARAGKKLTIAALAYDHARYDEVMFIDSMHLSAKWWGALGDGTTDDTAALQAFVNASPSGATLYFPGAGPYMVSQIVYKAERRYIGDAFGGYGTVVKQIASGTGDGVFVSYNWYNDVTQADNSTTFEDLTIHGNRANNTTGCGIITMGQRHYFHRLLIQDCDDDGIRFTETTRNSSTLAENAVANHIESCRIMDITGYGVYATDGSRFTDGYLIDSPVSGCDEDGVFIGSGSGWKINGCHLSTIKKNAIYLKNAGYSDTSHNYIEGYGSSDTDGTYHGIWVHGPNEIIVASNRIKNGNTTAGNVFHGVFIQGSSFADTYFNLSENIFIGNGTETAIRIEKSGATTVYGNVTGNRVHSADPLESNALANQIKYEANNWQAVTSTPAAGPWYPQGMRIYNNSSDARENVGWICIQAGTAPTWRAFGEYRDVNGWPGDHTRVYGTADVGIGTGAWTSLLFAAERYDNATLHGTTNTNRITFNRAGPALIGAGVRFAAGTAGQRGLRIYVNGATSIAEVYEDAPIGATTTWRRTITTAYYAGSGDYVECQVWQTSGGTLNVTYVADNSPYFWASQFAAVGP